MSWFLFAKDLALSVLTAAACRVLDFWVASRREEITEAADDLASTLERNLGLRRGSISIRVRTWPDGSSVPIVELNRDLTVAQFQAVTVAVENIKSAPINSKSPPPAYN